MLIKTIDRSYSNIHIERLVYVESMGNQSTFHMKDGKQIVCNISLKGVHELMPELYRISSSILLNEKELRSIRSVGPYYYFKLSNGEKLKSLSRSVFVKSFFANLRP